MEAAPRLDIEPVESLPRLDMEPVANGAHDCGAPALGHDAKGKLVQGEAEIYSVVNVKGVEDVEGGDIYVAEVVAAEGVGQEVEEMAAEEPLQKVAEEVERLETGDGAGGADSFAQVRSNMYRLLLRGPGNWQFEVRLGLQL